MVFACVRAVEWAVEWMLKYFLYYQTVYLARLFALQENLGLRWLIEIKKCLFLEMMLLFLFAK